MGLLSNKISRDDLKAGDHIYTWRTAYVYAHHGIYIGDGKVIHFTHGPGMEAGTGTVLDKFLVSLIPDPPNQCLTCGDQSHLDGVICSCLDCFLSGGNLLLYEYNVSKAILIANFRAGTCTKAPSDSPDEVISRAKFLLSKNGFGLYDLLENNCEDFAVYCKTSLVVGKSYILGRSGQAGSVSVLSFVANMFSLWAGTVIRVLRDIGMRYDTIKLPVEILVARRNKCD